jgi:hypothetical protein
MENELLLLDQIKVMESKILENRQRLCDLFAKAHLKLRQELPQEIIESGILHHVYKLTGMNPIRFSRFSKHIGDMNPTRIEIEIAHMLLEVPITEYEKQKWPGKEINQDK